MPLPHGVRFLPVEVPPSQKTGWSCSWSKEKDEIIHIGMPYRDKVRASRLPSAIYSIVVGNRIGGLLTLLGDGHLQEARLMS